MRIPTRYRSEIETPLRTDTSRMSGVASAFLNSSMKHETSQIALCQNVALSVTPFSHDALKVTELVFRTLKPPATV